MLNCGGFANPDVLRIDRPGEASLIVKDYGRRSAFVRHVLAPLLVRHEMAMLARSAGLEGLPALRGRVDALAFALEFVDGRPLRNRTHFGSLPPSFFDALQDILDGLAQRGLIYLDLSSPSNVMVRPSGAPALVDLASAFRLPVPRALRRALERRALRKLRERFEAAPEKGAVEEPQHDGSDLNLGGMRLRFLDRGKADDPTPVIFLHDIGQCSVLFRPILERAEAHGRRGIALDLPHFGASRGKQRSLAPAVVATWVDAWLDAMRLERVDVFGLGWGRWVAYELAARAPARVRALLGSETAAVRPGPGLDERRAQALHDPQALRRRIRDEVPSRLGPEVVAELGVWIERCSDTTLAHAYRGLPAEPLPSDALVEIADPFADADALWERLAR